MTFTHKKMVERVEWMSPVDYEILLFLDDHDIFVSPKVVAENIGYSRQYVSKRFQVLSEIGILRKEKSTGLYQLTEKGRQFLSGEINADDLGVPSD